MLTIPASCPYLIGTVPFLTKAESKKKKKKKKEWFYHVYHCLLKFVCSNV